MYAVPLSHRKGLIRAGVRRVCLIQIGGVVVASPFVSIAAYEREKGLPPHYINVSMYVTKNPASNRGSRLRGERRE